MALLAKTKNTIDKIGMNIPTPFSEMLLSPGGISNWYTKNPNKIKFNIMLSRPNTNWNFLFLKLKIENKDNKADPKNKLKYKYSSFANTFHSLHRM